MQRALTDRHLLIWESLRVDAFRRTLFGVEAILPPARGLPYVSVRSTHGSASSPNLPSRNWYRFRRADRQVGRLVKSDGLKPE